MPQTTRILIIEDDNDISQLLVRVLQTRPNIITTAAKTGAEAKLITQADLAIVDQHLPDMLGTDLVEHLNEHHIPFIFLTSESNPDVIEIAIKHGALGYLHKPIQVKPLLSAVAAAIARGHDIARLKDEIDTGTATGIIAGGRHITTNAAAKLLAESAARQRIKKTPRARDIIDNHDKSTDV